MKALKIVGMKPFNEDRINQHSRALHKATNDYFHVLFVEVVKPVLIRYKWRFAWANGATGFINKHNEIVENKTTEKLAKFVDELTQGYTNCSGLWEVACTIEPNYEQGNKYVIPAWCPAIDELGVNAYPHEIEEWYK